MRDRNNPEARSENRVGALRPLRCTAFGRTFGVSQRRLNENPDAMDDSTSYDSRWFARAKADTKAHWTPPLIAKTVAAPVVIAILWTIYKPWMGLFAVMQVALISILGFFALWGVVFFSTFFETPAQFEADMEEAHKAEVVPLREKLAEFQKRPVLSAKEQENRKSIEALIADAAPEEVLVLKAIHEREEISATNLDRHFPASCRPAISSAIGKWKPKLIDERVDKNNGERYWSIVPGLKSALEYMLYETQRPQKKTLILTARRRIMSMLTPATTVLLI